MKHLYILMSLLSVLVVLLFFQGCGETSENFEVTIKAPDQTAKEAVKTLRVYAIISNGDQSNCQNLLDGSSAPGDGNNQIVDSESVSDPANNKIRPLKVPKKHTGTLLFFSQGEDDGGNVIFGGCTEMKPGEGARQIFISLDHAYTVTFDGDGATVDANPTTITVILPATTVGKLPTEPTKDGYTFVGWYTETNGGGTEFTASTTVAASITVYAYWMPLTYTVSFDSQSATVPASPTSMTVTSPATTVGTLPTAPSKNGYTFAGWWTATGGGGTEFTASTVVTASITVYAYWTTSPVLTIIFDGNGSGTVTSNSSGIDCSSNCTRTISSGETVTLTATASTGSTFSGWSGGGCGGTGTCTVTVTAATTVTATFALNGYGLTVSKAGTGSGTVTSSSGGIDCGAVCSGSYTYGTSVTLTAAASTGSTFSGWSGGCGGTGTCTVTVTAATTVTATFNCAPSCQGKTCGDNGCGGSCPNMCTSPATCGGGTPGIPNQCGYLSLISVPEGTFQRDSGTGNNSTVSAFHMSQYEITQAQYQAITGVNPSYYTSVTNGPVEQVTWFDAVEFCNKLSVSEGLTPVYTINGRTPANGYPITGATVSMTNPNSGGYRLPTEMEWMWAAMGATSGLGDHTGGIFTNGYQKEFAGDPNPTAMGDPIGNYAWYSVNAYDVGSSSSDYGSHAVGTKLPNELGLYDMSGNVWEWCWDWYADNGTWPNYAITGPVTNYTGPASGSNRVQRGGSWFNNASNAAVACRNDDGPAIILDSLLGFRVVRP